MTVTRMSQLFVRTLRDDPADAELPSHRLLVRAGYIRRAAPGIYTWLPLGLKVLERIEQVVRDEMVAMGAQEVRFPALLPADPYRASGRDDDYGPLMFRLRDRRGSAMVLGPTHEEMFTLLVKDICSSYKDLPLVLFQVQTKYRDEARPRAGLLRGREFTMKDSYSFDVDEAGLDAAYAAHRAAYARVADRLGLEYVIVQAVSGAMGGSRSEEFLVVAENGEDTFVRCDTCDYAANVEAVRVRPAPRADWSGFPAAHAEDTPDTPTIATLVETLNARFPRDDGREWDPADTLKNVLVMLVHPDGRREPLAIGVPGDREVDEARLEAAVFPARVEPFDDVAFAAHPTLARGYMGPGSLGSERAEGVRYLVDPRVADGTRWVTGADSPGRHVLGLVAGRDFTADGTIEVAEVRDGDACPDCDGGLLCTARGIEFGHIFQLGTRYSDLLGLTVLDRNGTRVPVTMGSYGLGLSRAVAELVENSHDERGIVWPDGIGPADVHVVVAGKDAAVAEAAGGMAHQLAEAGQRVLLDDRGGVSPGVKFTDAELIGVPLILVVGRRWARDGVVEVRERRSGQRRECTPEDVVAQVSRSRAAAS